MPGVVVPGALGFDWRRRPRDAAAIEHAPWTADGAILKKVGSCRSNQRAGVGRGSRLGWPESNTRVSRFIRVGVWPLVLAFSLVRVLFLLLRW